VPHYLIQATYTAEGAAGVAARGGTARRDAVDELITSAGGRLEAFYFAFGDPDVYAIGELPDDDTMAAIALSINRSGSARIKTTVLLTAQQIDRAADRAPMYRRPGG
jgi:uncharacterized protein with GYD domain